MQGLFVTVNHFLYNDGEAKLVAFDNYFAVIFFFCSLKIALEWNLNGTAEHR